MCCLSPGSLVLVKFNIQHLNTANVALFKYELMLCSIKKRGQNTWHLLQDFMTVVTFYSTVHSKIHLEIWTAWTASILTKNNYTVCIWMYKSLNDLPPVPLCLPQLQLPLSSCTVADSQSPAPSSELYQPFLALSTAVVKYLRDRSPRKVESQHIQQRKILVLDKLREASLTDLCSLSPSLLWLRAVDSHPGWGDDHSYTQLCCELNTLSHTEWSYLTPHYPPA